MADAISTIKTAPASFTVLIDMTEVATGKISTRRMGNYITENAAITAIVENEESARKLRLNDYKRAYRVFKAEWTELFVD
jgi:hypothetical protein